MKYEVGDRVRIKSIDWYNENKDTDGVVHCGNKIFDNYMSVFCGSVVTIGGVYPYNGYDIREDMHCRAWTDDMIEGLVEEKTPKFKVNDIVFVKNAGWVRITNSYCDSLANEYIYEAIGFDGKSEYDCISQSNIECQMLPESENPPHTGGNKITLDEYKNNDKEWLFNKLAMLDNITALESIQDIFNHLQQSKYPKTYEECCEVLVGRKPNPNEISFDKMELCLVDLDNTQSIDFQSPHLFQLNSLFRLLMCRDAYWKIAGEEMGLGKPWEPDWLDDDTKKYVITSSKVFETFGGLGYINYILTFPTEEMRDAFYENFKEEIEICKEFL